MMYKFDKVTFGLAASLIVGLIALDFIVHGHFLAGYALAFSVAGAICGHLISRSIEDVRKHDGTCVPHANIQPGA